MKRKCSRCKQEKDLTIENFATRTNRDGWQSLCRICQREYRKQHYELNKKKYIEKSHKYRVDFKRNFYLWLSTQSCQDCGLSDIRVLEFDHRKDKLYNISEILNSCSHKLLWEEVVKCDIVCANCHRIRTAQTFNYYSYLE